MKHTFPIDSMLLLKATAVEHNENAFSLSHGRRFAVSCSSYEYKLISIAARAINQTDYLYMPLSLVWETFPRVHLHANWSELISFRVDLVSERKMAWHNLFGAWLHTLGPYNSLFSATGFELTSLHLNVSSKYRKWVKETKKYLLWLLYNLH